MVGKEEDGKVRVKTSRKNGRGEESIVGCGGDDLLRTAGGAGVNFGALVFLGQAPGARGSPGVIL